VVAATLLGSALLLAPGRVATILWTDVPQKLEQVVYSAVTYDGAALQSTFATEHSDTVYLPADVDSFVSVRKAFVYYWPLTREWKTDSDTLNEQLTGSLVIWGAQHRVLLPVDYTYRSITNRYGILWESYTDEQARQETAEYQDASDALARAVIVYTNTETRLNAERGRLIDAIRSLVRAGKTAEAQRLVRQYNSLVEPVAPVHLGYEVRPLQQAFDVNLPTGTYSMHFRDLSGGTLEGSEKRLVVFSGLTAGAIGYDIIPGDRWTRSEESSSVGDALYVSGTSDLYLRPFEETEFNDLDYARMVDNQSLGSPRLFRWVRTQQVQSSVLHVRAEGAGLASAEAASTVVERPYFVHQVPGSSLGYQIVPFNPSQPDQQGHDPSLVAFHLPSGFEHLRFYLSRPDGTRYPGSEREVRMLRQDRHGKGLFLLALLPLLGLGAPVLRRLKSGKT
jgi:hypothetical protein